MTFHLINLDCPACGSAMSAGPHDIIFLCSHCGSGAVLGDTELELVESTALLPVPGRRATLWRPGWSIEAEVLVDERRGVGGRVTPGGSSLKNFIIPAFALDLQDLTPLAIALTSAASTTGEVPKEPCHGGTLDLEDALVFIRYLIVGAEVSRPDDLATVRVEVTPVSHHIVALPFERIDGRLRCAVTGTIVRDQ
ncbi:MAG: hypothetical protein DRJ65_22650 [Acidobacteria bacterium]|nr:MAG: hypothetical protein DRJ65_22650 [Acidobacteriota bacterium]